VLLQLCLFVGAANAYDLEDCDGNYDYVFWPDSTAVMYINTTSFSEGSATHELLEDMTHEYDGAATHFPGTDFDLVHDNDDDQYCYPIPPNYRTEVCNYDADTWENYWGNSPDMVAKTYLRYGATDCEITQADVYFNGEPHSGDVEWTTHPPGWPGTASSIMPTGARYTGDKVSRPAVVIHEYGHVVGLEHEGGWPDTMNATTPHGSYSDFQPDYQDIDFDVQESAREGVRYVYPSASSGQDLAVSNWRYGWYIADDTGWLQCHPGQYHGDVILEYELGDYLQYWFYYVNLGSDSQEDVYVGVYLSEDSEITTSDHRIAYFMYNVLHPNTPALAEMTTWLCPRTTPTGTFYLGTIIDVTDVVDEYDEGNNYNLCAEVAVIMDMRTKDFGLLLQRSNDWYEEKKHGAYKDQIQDEKHPNIWCAGLPMHLDFLLFSGKRTGKL
jgi:hypothetical protein